MSNQTRTYIKLFISGSSFPAVIWPFLYLGIAAFLNPNESFRFELIPATLPFLFGLINIMRHLLRDYLFPKNIKLHYWTIGLLYGFVLSLFANLYGNIPLDLFLLPDTAVQYLTIPFAIILYALVWRYIIKNINELFGIK